MPLKSPNANIMSFSEKDIFGDVHMGEYEVLKRWLFINGLCTRICTGAVPVNFLRFAGVLNSPLGAALLRGRDEISPGPLSTMSRYRSTSDLSTDVFHTTGMSTLREALEKVS